ncbi:hypothetical protein HMPREF1602_00501 [Escherichia coli 907889]|nr:hypothetical protein HMPREF1602_00501 [Escherichia coli 907889]
MGFLLFTCFPYRPDWLAAFRAFCCVDPIFDPRIFYYKLGLIIDFIGIAV